MSALSQSQMTTIGNIGNAQLKNDLLAPLKNTLTYAEFLDHAIHMPFDWKIWAEFEYQGLDPEKIFKAMRDKATGGGKSMATFINDVQKIMTWYVRRGTNINDDKRSTKEGYKEIKALKTFYGLTKNLSGKDNEGMTIGRVAATFGEMAMVHFHLGTATPVADHQGLPQTFAFTGSPALMTDQEWSTYKTFYLRFALNVHRTLNVRNKSQMDKTDDVVIAEQTQYCENARNSKFNIVTRKSKRLYVSNMVKAMKGDVNNDPFLKNWASADSVFPDNYLAIP